MLPEHARGHPEPVVAEDDLSAVRSGLAGPGQRPPGALQPRLDQVHGGEPMKPATNRLAGRP